MLPEGMVPALSETAIWSPPELEPPSHDDRINTSLTYGFVFDMCGVEIDPVVVPESALLDAVHSLLMILDGWGIHLSIRGGWVWNLWGRDCVVVHLTKGVLRIGTDDAENFARFLEGKVIHQGN